MLGSLTFYRRILLENVFSPRTTQAYAPSIAPPRAGTSQVGSRLPIAGHAIAGMMAGWTVSFIAAP